MHSGANGFHARFIRKQSATVIIVEIRIGMGFFFTATVLAPWDRLRPTIKEVQE